MIKKPKPPSEHVSAVKFAAWLSDQTTLLFSHLPLNTWTSTSVTSRLRSEGVRKGVPDYLIVDKATGLVLLLELKREKPARSKVSAEQREWLLALGPRGALVYGHREAINLVASYFGLEGT